MKNKKGQWLFYLGLAMLFIGVAALITAIVAEFTHQDVLFKASGITIAIAGPLAIILIIVKFIFFGGADEPVQNVEKPSSVPKEVKTVDVKEVPKSQEEIMYDKYVDLYNRKIISKEDLEKKRIELLGK